MKTVLITGSTDGIGKLTALNLAKAGHQIFLHGRNKEKLQTTIVEIKKQSNNQNIDGVLSDFSELRSIRSMSIELTKKLSHIDVLINNAGVYRVDMPITKDGFDVRFAVNYFAPYLLTNQLLPLLKKSKSPRVINLSSAAQEPISLELLRGNKQVTESRDAYAQSKLALTIWSFHFAKINPNITTIAVNPGSLLNTKMVAEAYGKYWYSADKGADILVDLMTEDKYRIHTGSYFDNDASSFSVAHPDAYRKEVREKLLDATIKLLQDF